MREDLEGRNGQIWRDWVCGKTQEAIGAEYGISQSRVAQVIAQVRATIPPADRALMVTREVDFLDHARTVFVKLAQAPLPPAFDTKGGVLVDPSTKEIVRDATGRVSALKAALETQTRLAKLLGLDAPVKAEISLDTLAQDAANQLAADAVAYLNGDTEPLALEGAVVPRQRIPLED